MSATKIWSIGDVLTASDLNGNFSKLPYASAAFTYNQVATLAPGVTTTFAVAFPASRFNVAPIVTISTSSPWLTGYVSANTAGTVTVGLANNAGSSSSTANTTVTGFAVQMTSGTAAG
jgi:hypothetical protein